MSTKFRQSFFLLCDDCRRSPKRQRSCNVLFYKDYNRKKATDMNGYGRGTISTTIKHSFHQTNQMQYVEGKSLLTDQPLTPTIEVRMNDRKYSFSECYI